jgi:septal ring factor EnvC (AmiA/AmiB activator)
MGTILTGTIAALWKTSESKNSMAIEEQRRELSDLKNYHAAAESEMKTELNLARQNLHDIDAARIQCERDRAVLMTKCEMFEKRIQSLEVAVEKR